jgi:hypothetical protein
MKKTLLTVALVAMSAVASFGQGTIAFGNSVAARIAIKDSPEATARTATAADGLTFGVFFGPAGSAEGALTQAPGTATIGTATPGILAGAASVFALPGTEAQQIVSLQIRAWDASGKVLGATDVRQVTLGPTAGPGAVIWQGSTGVNPTRFNPLVVTVPEPSTIALGVLGLGSLLLFRRRK